MNRTARRIREQEAADELAAAERLGAILGFTDAPLCEFCGGDVHTRPDCPVKARQDRYSAEARRAILGRERKRRRA